MSDEPLDQPDFVETFAASTTDLPEGTNLYYTNARARASLSAGFGISYDNITGVISYGGFSSDDTLLPLGFNNTADLLDIGFVGAYDSAGTKYTGLFRDASDGKYKLYQGLTSAPTANVVDLTGGVLADLSVGSLSATSITGTLQTSSQPLITTLGGVTTIRNIPVGANAIGDGSTALTGVLQTVSQPLITTLANVTSLNSIPISVNSLGNSATELDGVLQNGAQPNITTLTSVTNINSVPVGNNAIGDDTTALRGSLLTTSQPNITTLGSVSTLNGIPVSANAIGNSSTALSGVLQTGSQPNITTLANTTSVNSIPVSANAIGNISTALSGVLQTAGQPNILLVENNLTSLIDVTTANATVAKHGLMPKLSGSNLEIFLGDGTWGSISTVTLPSLLLNGPANAGDAVDVGFLGTYVSSGTKYTGMFRDATDGKYKLYHGLTVAPGADVVNLTSGVLSELVLGTLTATNITGLLQTSSQPSITTLGNVTNINSVPVGPNSIGDGFTALTGVLQTAAQPFITTLDGVTEMNSIPVANNSIGNNFTALYGVLQTASQPSLAIVEANLASLIDVTTANATIAKHGLLPKLSGNTSQALLGNGTWGAPSLALSSLLINGDSNAADIADIGFIGKYFSGDVKYTGLFRDATDGKYKLYHDLLTGAVGEIVDLYGGVLSELVLGTLTATNLSGTITTAVQPNITDLTNITNLNFIPVGVNAIGNGSTALSGVLQTATQPNIAIVESNLSGFTDVTTANATTLKHGLLPKLSGNVSQVLKGDGTWGSDAASLSSLNAFGTVNAGDALDIGFYGIYTNAGSKYTGLFRDATDGKYKLYHGLTIAPTGGVVSLTSGVLSELVLGTLTATTVAGTLSTASQPNVTTLAGVTSLNGWTVGSGTLSGGSSISATSITGTLQTASQPNITTLASVTSLNSIPISSNALGNGSTALSGVLQTASQPNITTLSNVTSLNSITVGASTLSGLSSVSATSLAGTLTTASQPNITTLASVTSINSIPHSSNALGNGSTALSGILQTGSQPNITTLAGVTSIGANNATTLTGTLQTASQPNITTLASVNSLNGWTVGSGTLSGGSSVSATSITGTLQTASQPNITTLSGVTSIGANNATTLTGTLQTALQPNVTTLAGVTSLNGWTIGSGTLSGGSSISATSITGTLATASQPNITTLAGVTSVNSIPVSSNALGNSSTVLTGVIQTASQPNIAIVESNLASFTDITTANATNLKHGLLPKLSNVVTDVLRGDGSWGLAGISSLILNNPTNPADLLDIGFLGTYTSAGTKYTGMFRDATDGKYKLYHGLTVAPTSNVVDLTSGILSELVLGILTATTVSATNLTGTLQTASQPNVTTLAGVTGLNGWTVGSGTLSGGSSISATNLTGTLATVSQPNITTLAGVTSLNSITVGSGTLSGLSSMSATNITGTLQTVSQPLITTLAGVTSIGASGATTITGTLQTASQPNITTLAGVTSIGANNATTVTGTLQTASQPNITTLAGVTSLNTIPVSSNALGNGSTALTGVLQTSSQPNIAIVEANLVSLTDVTTANATAAKHGLLPKLSNVVTDVLRGDGTWGLAGVSSLILNNPTNPADLLDIGFLGTYVSAGTKYTGMFRDATDGKYKLYHGLTVAPTSNVVDLTSGVLSELVVGTLTATTLSGTLSTASQPNITALAGVTSLNGITVGSGTLSGLTSVSATSITGTLATVSQPNITTLAGVTSIGASGATTITGTLQTASQPNITTLAGVTSLNGWTIGTGTLSGGSSVSATNITGTLATASQPNITTLAGVTSVGASGATTLTGTLQTASQPNVTTLAGVTSINSIPVSSNALGNGSTALTGVIQTGSQPNIAIVESNLASLTDVTTANATNLKHGLLPKLSNVSTDVLKGDGTWGAPSSGTLPALLLPNPTNPADLLDIGFLGTYVSAGTKYTGLFRDATDGKYKLYHGLTVAPTADVVDLTSGVLSELVVGTLTATNLAGTLFTTSQPNVTTLAGVTSLNGWTIGLGTLSGGSSVSATSITGTLATVSQPNITTLAGVTSIGASGATTLTGTLQTASQPNVTTLASVTSLNSITVGSGTLSGLSSISATSITGTLQTASQPNITTLAAVTSLNGWTIGSGTLSGGSSISATSITGTLATVSQPNITTLAGVTSIGASGATTITGTLQTASQPNVTTLAGVTSLNGWTVGSGTLSGGSSVSATNLTGTLATVSQPNITTLAGVTSLNSIPVSSNALGNGSTALTGVIQTASQPNISIVESNLASLSDVTTANATAAKHGLLPKLSNVATDVLRGDGTWGLAGVSSLILNNPANPADLLDIGFLGTYVSAGTKYTGMFRDATDGKYKLYHGLTVAPTSNVVDLTSGVLSELVVGTLTATDLAGTLSTVSQPNVTTLAGVTSLNSIIVGSGTLSGLSSISATSIIGTLATASQPNITTLAGVTSLNSIPVSSNALGNGSTALTGVIQTVSQPNITTLAGVTSIGASGATTLTGTLQTASQPNVTTLAGVTSLNGWTVGSGTLSGGSSISATSITGTLATASQPNVTTLAGVTSLNSIPVSSNALGNGSTALTGVIQTAAQPNITTLAGVTSLNNIVIGNNSINVTDLTVTNLTANGTVTYVNSTNLSITDPLISLATGNTATDVLDIGVYGTYASAGTKYTGLFRDATDDKWKLYTALTVAPSSTIDITSGSLGELVVGILTATTLAGTLSTASQPNVTTLAGVTSLNGWTVGSGTLSGGSSISATSITGTLATASQPNITTLAGVTSLNSIPVSANALGNGSTALTGVIQTASQPNISVLEANLAGFTDVTTANSTALKHGLLPKLSNVSTDVLKGDGTWGAAPVAALPALALHGPSNPADLLDIGFLGTYVSSGTKYTGMFRDATDGKYKLYHGLTVAPTGDVVDLTSGVLSELVLSTLTATTVAGTLSTASQPNITTLAGVTSLNSITVGSGTLSGLSSISATSITGTLATVSQPNITTLAGVTSIGASGATTITGTLQTASQPNITTLAGVTSLNGWTVGSGTLSGGSSISATSITGTLQTASQPNVTTLAGVTSLNGITVGSGTLSGVTTINGSPVGTAVLPSLLLNGTTNPADLLDIGFLGTYVSSGTKYAGLFRDATDGKYKLYHGLTVAPTADVVDLTSGVLSELVVGTLTATNLAGTLSTASQPNVTTLAGVTSLNSITVGSGTLSGLSSVSATSITGTLATASQPNITTLAGVTSLNSITVGSGTLSGLSSVSATSITGTLATVSQPNITTLAGVTSIGASGSTTLTGTLQTVSQPNVTTLAGVTSLNGWTVGSGTLSGGSSISATSITGTLQTASQPNITTLAGVTSLNGWTVGSGTLSGGSSISATSITGTLATASQPNITTLAGVTSLNGITVGSGTLSGITTINGSPVGTAVLPSLLLNGTTNPADLLDIGFLGTYVSSGTKYTGMFRDATDGKYKLYHGLTVGPTADVVDLTSGVLSELVLGTLTATTVAGTLSTASQPNVTTLAGVTSLNSITVGSGTLSGLSSVSATSITGTLQTASQPNITTLAGVTSLNSITVGSGTLSGLSSISATSITGTLATVSQPNITTLAGVTSIGASGATTLTGTLQTASQPNVTTLAGVTSLNSITVGSGTLSGLSSISATSITGTLATASQPNITTLAAVTSLNGWTVGSGTLSGGSSVSATNLTGTLQTASQPNISVLEANLAGFTDITTANSTSLKHGLLPKLSGVGTDVLKGDGTWGAPSAGSLASLMLPGPTNPADLLDIGFLGTYVSAGTKYTGMFRDATDGKYKLYHGLTVAPTTDVVDLTSGVLSELVVGTLTSTTLAGTLSTASQPNVTTLAGVTSLNSITVGSGTLSSVTTINGITMTPTGSPSTISTANAAGTGTTYARIDHVHSHGNLAGGALHADATISVAGFMSAADKVKLDGLTPNASYEAVSQNIGDYNKAFAYSMGKLSTITYTKGPDTIVKTFNYTVDVLTSMVLSGDTPGGIPLTKTFTYSGADLTGITYS